MSSTRRSSPQWQQILFEQQTSGQSVAEFCRSAELSPASFYLWRRKLQGQGAINNAGDAPGATNNASSYQSLDRLATSGAPIAELPSFASCRSPTPQQWTSTRFRNIPRSPMSDLQASSAFVELLPPQHRVTPATAIKLHLPGGLDITIPPGFDPLTLREVLNVLGSLGECRQAPTPGRRSWSTATQQMKAVMPTDRRRPQVGRPRGPRPVSAETQPLAATKPTHHQQESQQCRPTQPIVPPEGLPPPLHHAAPKIHR